MKVELNKKYILRNGDIATITKILNLNGGIAFGELLGTHQGQRNCDRWEISTGRHWNYIYGGATFNTAGLDIILRASWEGRIIGWFLRQRTIYKTKKQFLNNYNHPFK